MGGATVSVKKRAADLKAVKYLLKPLLRQEQRVRYHFTRCPLLYNVSSSGFFLCVISN